MNLTISVHCELSQMRQHTLHDSLIKKSQNCKLMCNNKKQISGCWKGGITKGHEKIFWGDGSLNCGDSFMGTYKGQKFINYINMCNLLYII